MHQQAQQNPLKQFFRSIKLYTKLPSLGTYYGPDVIQFNDSNEVGVLPMTGNDELILKNPDALLNGEALIDVITSCVPAVKQPRALLNNDIEALITAIRYATFNNTLETSMKCPRCSHENTYSLDLQYAMDNMEFLEPEYNINLDSGISVFVKPYSFPDLLKVLHAQFEQSKIVRAIESDKLSEQDRAETFKRAFREMAKVKFELMANGIVKIVSEEHGVNVDDKRYITEFLYNTDKRSIDKISDLIEEINKIGIKKSFSAKCQKCEHEWESDIDFNPVNFS